MNFAYNYVMNITNLQQILLQPYLKEGKIIQDVRKDKGYMLTIFRDLETEEPVALLEQRAGNIIFYEKKNTD